MSDCLVKRERVSLGTLFSSVNLTRYMVGVVVGRDVRFVLLSGM